MENLRIHGGADVRVVDASVIYADSPRIRHHLDHYFESYVFAENAADTVNEDCFDKW